MEKTFESTVIEGIEALQKRYEVLEKKGGTDTEELKKAHNELSQKVDEFRRNQIAIKQSSGIVRPGRVSDDCARHLAGIVVATGIRKNQIRGDWAEGFVRDALGVHAKTALTSTDIPLPVGYGTEVVELVSQYGAARRLGTVYPLGNGVVNLPRLKTSPAFGLIAGSGTVTEVSPQTEWVAFTAEKFGGLIRLPSELDEDSAFSLGQFLARYTAREIAKVEDHNYFVGTGAASGANGTIAGLCATTITNSKVAQMGSTKTHRSDTTLANLRAVRGVVDAAALRTARYAMHPSFEQLLSNLNTAGDHPYNSTGLNGSTLDGYPIEWVDIMPVYSTSATVSTVHVLFGDFSYQYLGTRGSIRFDTSTEAGFTTDEILVRALERFTIGLMAVGAIAGLETAAS